MKYFTHGWNTSCSLFKKLFIMIKFVNKERQMNFLLKVRF